MGDASNMADIERFMRSEDGKAHLNEIVEMLNSRTIVDVTFENDIWCVSTTIHLDNGETFDVFQPSLEVDALREEFGDVIQKEYFKDYPARRPKENRR